MIEVIVVAAIIGVLATIALPRFNQFQAKARTAEAVKNLHSIYALEVVHHTSQHTYASIGEPGVGADLLSVSGICKDTANDLGFDIAPCNPSAKSPLPRYAYTVKSSASTFAAIARTGDGEFNRVCKGNSAHFFAIDQNQKFIASVGALPNAPASSTSSLAGSVLPIGKLCPNK